jgi:hypothetical protein
MRRINRAKRQERVDMALGLAMMAASLAGLCSLPWLWPLLAQ